MIIENEQAEIESIRRMVESKEERAFYQGQQRKASIALNRAKIEDLVWLKKMSAENVQFHVENIIRCEKEINRLACEIEAERQG